MLMSMPAFHAVVFPLSIFEAAQLEEKTQVPEK